MSYISIDDDHFYRFINRKYSKYKISSKNKSFNEICFPSKFEFQIPQQFLAEYMSPDTPYRNLLIYHRIGAGKTCSAIKIAEGFKNVLNIIIVLPASLKGNFLSELRSPCTGNEYISEKERANLALLTPGSEAYRQIIDRSNSRITEIYQIYSYNKFIKLLVNRDIKLDNTIVIIDEIHNLISARGKYYKILYNAFHQPISNFRLVLMSATPIFDKPTEIALTMNLLLPIDKQLPIEAAFRTEFMDVISTDKGLTYNVKNIGLFRDTIKGYVSYYRGAPPYVFPRSSLEIINVPMSSKQYTIYKKILKKESKNTKLLDYVNNDISNSFFIGSRMASNIIYPNNFVGEEGFSSLRDKDLDLKNISILAPKFIEIWKRIEKSKGPVFIYSNFKGYGGIKTLTLFLEHHGYQNYLTGGPSKKSFAVWSGEEDAVVKEEIKVVFNKRQNVDGSLIKIILGSPSIKEGVSLLRVKQVHILEPYWNNSRIAQVIGRANRFCSHKDLPEKDQFVEAYIYAAVHPKEKLSIDQYIIKMANQKLKVNSYFETALKEAAIDCSLFKNANVYSGEQDIKCVI